MPRKKQRKIIDIKIWLLRRKARISDIALRTGVSRASVSKTINGTRNSRPVLRWLRDNGCPAEYLALPDDMQKEKR